MTSIKNFIPLFPKPGDPDLGKKVAHLKEFSDKRLHADELEHTEPGIPYDHQDLQGRYFSPQSLNTTGLIVHGLGAGKTCTASLLVEEFKKTFFGGIPRAPALIILKSGHLRESFRASIGKECTKAIYTVSLDKEIASLTDQGIIEINERTIRTRMNAAISESYEIVTERELFDARKVRSDDYHIREYSNRMIIIDESHSYQDHPVKISKKEKKDPSKKPHKTAYQSLHHFLHILVNCRIYLFTGTPIWDQVYGIASQFNLILPLDKQLPVLDDFTEEFFDKNGRLRPEKISILKNAMRGKISYVRSKRTDKRVDWGTVSPWLKFTKVYPSVMSDFQYKYSELAKKHVKHTEFKTKDEKKKKGGGYYTTARDAVNCVYPEIKNNKLTGEGVYGTDAFLDYSAERKHVKITTTKTDPKSGIEMTKEKDATINTYAYKHALLKKELGPSDDENDRLSNLRKYSTKFATIIEMLIDPDRLKEKAFVYLESVNGTGGAISFAMIAQLYGFKWIKYPESIGKHTYEATVTAPGAFVVITTEPGTIKDAAQIRETLEKYNSDSNVYGEHVRIIIGSETISHGHTLKATRQGHAVAGYWNFPSVDQPMGRIYRLGSFKQLPEEERFVNFYLHAAVIECGTKENKSACVKLPENVGNLRNKLVSTKESVDIHVYKAAEEKEIYNSQIYRVMKETAWDCALTYERNVLDGDVDGSRDCDLTNCDYVCDGWNAKDIKPKPGAIRYSYELNEDTINPTNYNLLYSQKQIKEYIEEIRELFRSYFVIQFDVLLNNLGLIEDKDIENNKFVVITALNKIINERIPIVNKYGIATFLKEDRDVYFLDNTTSAIPSYPMSIYGILPFVSEITTLEDAIETVQLKKDKGIVSKFIGTPSLDLFLKISHRSRIIILESVVEMEHSGDTPISCANPKDIINIVKSVEGKELYTMSDGVIVHNMYNTKETGAKYNILTKDLKLNGKLRVFDPASPEDGWNYINRAIEASYINEIKQSVEASTTTGFEDNPYDMYGMVDKTNKFKIVRKGNKGSVCKYFSILDLQEMFYKLNVLPYESDIKKEYDVGDIRHKNRPLMLEILMATDKGLTMSYMKNNRSTKFKDMSVEDMRKLYALLNMSKDELCASLERWFRGDNAEGKVYFSEQ